MMAKIVKGSDFKGAVDYIIDKKKDTQIVASEGLFMENLETIAMSFNAQSRMNDKVTKPVGHIALSFSKEDELRLTNRIMAGIALEYMERMGIKNTQFFIAQHFDKEHPHVHIVFNRIDNNGKTISDRNDMYRNEQVCKKLKAKHGLYFAGGKEQVKQHRLKEPDKSKYEIYHAVKNEIGKSRNWQQLQGRLAEKGITIRFKYKGQANEIQGVSFSKGEYTFKGSEIDRSFSFSKLDKCFGDVGQTTVGSNKQTVTAPVQKSVSAPDKADNSFITGLGGLFSGLSAPADEMPDDSFLRKKKKKKKKQLKL